MQVDMEAGENNTFSFKFPFAFKISKANFIVALLNGLTTSSQKALKKLLYYKSYLILQKHNPTRLVEIQTSIYSN